MDRPFTMTDELLTVREALLRSANYLKDKGSQSPRLDAEVLLAEVLSSDRLHLYLDIDRPLDADERDRYREFIRRRATLEPVAYIVGYKEFYGLPFEVDRRTLIPRPETEFVVEAALEFARTMPEPRILDVGAGSGAIIVALARELESARMYSTEASEGALEVARENAQRLGVGSRIEFVLGDLYAGLGEFDLVVSNPPYISESERQMMQPDVLNFEPAEALFAGADGLDVIRRLVAEAPMHLRTGGRLMFEFGFGQLRQIEQLITSTPQLRFMQFIPDLRNIPRVAVAEKVQS